MDKIWSSDAAVHLESLQLLAEAAQYLGRLPRHPLTHNLMSRIEAHLDRPGSKVHKDRLESIAKDMDWRSRMEAGECYSGASRFTPAGLPVVECLIVRGTVNLRSPAHDYVTKHGTLDDANKLATAIGRDITAGLSFQLAAADKITLKSWVPFEPKTSGSKS